MFIYFDNLNCYSNMASSSNLFCDPGFEELDMTPSSHILRSGDLPYGWSRTWDSNYDTTDYYITPDSSEGTQALAISSKTEEISHTIANTLTGLDTEKSYTVEATFKKTGKITNATVFFNDGTSNVTIIDIDSKATSSYVTASGTFTPTDSSTALNIYVNAPKRSTLIIDDIIVYETSDSTKTNLMVNGGFEPYTEAAELDCFEGTLSDEWSCLENRNADLDYTKFVDVTSHQAKYGYYAMRIGHSYADTDITLRYKKTVENGEYTYSAYLKATGTPLSDSAITMRDGESGTAVESTLTDLTESWTKYSGTVTVTGGELIIDFNIVLKAGYFTYIDYMNLVNTSAPANQLNTDNSFERFYVTTNNAADGYEDTDFVSVVSDKSAAGDYSLRIGNSDTATDLIMEYKVAVINDTTDRSDTFRFKADVYFEGDTTDSATCFKYGVLSGVNWRQIKLSDVTGNEWVNINNSIQLNSSEEVKTSGPYLYNGSVTYTVRVIVKCNAGEYLYIDNLNVYNGNYTSNNLIPDASFENYSLKNTVFTTDTPLTSSLVKPSNWSVSWSEYKGYRYNYRSNEAHSGDYALALTAKGKKMYHTYKQSISSKVEVGAEYTVEGYFKKVGTFGSVNIMETASGLSNYSIMQLKDTTMNEYTYVKGTFTARTGSNLSIYTTSGADSLLLIDDLKIYRSDDETQTNILSNGDFESWTASNQEQYRVKKTFANTPQTFEATVKISADLADDESAGVIIGNYNGFDASFNLEATTNGNPRVYVMDDLGKAYDIVFEDVDLRTGEWTHITAVKNTASIDLYIDGVLAGSEDFAATVNTAANPYAISGDLITSNIQYWSSSYSSKPTNYNYFKGEIKNAAFYDDIRSAEEIAADVTEYGTEGLIAEYNLWNVSDPEIIPDDTENGYYALRYSQYITELQAEDDDETAFPYSMVAIGDTQYVCEYDKKYGTDDMSPIYDWVLNNKESKNIQFVMGLGDITDEGTDGEYAIAATQFKKLQDADIRYSIIKGNHDGIWGYDDGTTRDPANFDEYLAEGYTYDGIYNAPTFDEEGSLVSGSVDLTYHKVEVSGQKWLILAMPHNASEEQFAWANEVISSNSDYRVIITVHAYIKGNRDVSWAYTNRSSYSSGEYVWTNLASLHENVAMVLCGHHNTIDVSVNKRVGVNGNVVTEMLIDRQDLDINGSNLAHVTLLRFSADGTQVKVEDYSTGREKYFRPSNQFIVDIQADETENSAALFNFNSRLGRYGLYDNKDLEMQNLLSELRANITAAEGSEAVATAYNTAVSAVTPPDAPVVTLEGTTATITATDGFEYSMDGITWQDSPVFSDLPFDTALSFYQRQSANATGYTSLTSVATVCAITSAPTVLVGETSIWVKPLENCEYSIDAENWQTSNVFNTDIVNAQSYTVYQRPVGSEDYTLLLNGTTVTVDGHELVENLTVTDLASVRESLLENDITIDVSMDHNSDWVIDARDIVVLKKYLANLEA